MDIHTTLVGTVRINPADFKKRSLHTTVESVIKHIKTTHNIKRLPEPKKAVLYDEVRTQLINH